MALVGDRWDTNILFGQQGSLLVLSGGTPEGICRPACYEDQVGFRRSFADCMVDDWDEEILSGQQGQSTMLVLSGGI